MARQYALPEGASRGDPRGLTPYIRETAKKYGIDPEVAVRVAKSEGLSTFRSGVRRKDGSEEPSFGAFQLYTGGGLGNKFQAETGLDPSDPANEKATIDYALKTAAKEGWGQWYGAKKVGVKDWDGIPGGGGAATADTAIKGTNADTTAPETPQSGPQVAGAAPPAGFLDKLKDQGTGASAGLGEAIQGLGAATTGASRGGLYDTPRVAPIPISPTPPPQMVPTVNPQIAENQRQQLAAAMQRLNAGKLY